MKKQTLVERFQKLAGIEILNEVFNPFLDTEEGGYMREYIDDVVEDSMGEPESLDLEYRSDFDIAFNLALSKLSHKQFPKLYLSDDSKLAPEFITPKGIGFVMNNNEGNNNTRNNSNI
jgi:hypothetical protein